MIPVAGCDPKINVIFIGSEILNLLIINPMSIEEIITKCTSKLQVSVDHILLSIDWLYMISAINIFDEKLRINEITQSNN